MKHHADAAAAMQSAERTALPRGKRVLRSAREILHSRLRCKFSGGDVVARLSHGLSSFVRNAAQMPRTLCAGHKKARSDPPGRDTHSYDDGLNTQDSVTQVNPFSASSHAHTGIDHCPSAVSECPTCVPGLRRSDIVRLKRSSLSVKLPGAIPAARTPARVGHDARRASLGAALVAIATARTKSDKNGGARAGRVR